MLLSSPVVLSHAAVLHTVQKLVWAANTFDTQTAQLNWKANPDRAAFKGHFLPLICGNVSQSETERVVQVYVGAWITLGRSLATMPEL